MREGIAESYVGVVQGLKAADKAVMLVNFTNQIFHFLQTATVSDPERPEFVTKSLIGLIGDLADAFPPGQFKPLFSADWIDGLLREVKANRSAYSSQTKEVTKWAKEMVKRQVM